MDASTRAEIREFLENKVHDCKVLVIGDVMLDRYFYGNVTRISPEAPVPVNCIEKKKDTLGGAANVAHNLARLGCQVYLSGVIGDDHHGRLLMRKLEKRGIHTDGIICGREKTTTKVRVLGGHQQMMRLDFEETDSIEDSAAKQLQAVIDKITETGLDAVIISDYGKGMCTDEMCQYVIKKAQTEDVPVFVDPKGDKWGKYRGASYITPNVKEAGAVLNCRLANDTEVLRKAAEEIKKRYAVDSVMITRSEKGISVFGRSEITIPTVAQEVFDVSGAGDTVISCFAAAIGMKVYLQAAIEFANFAAGIEVGKVGTYAVSNEEIVVALGNM
ncbi:D-glycero-beta-D-manno-heptose-7-phosphate kinase [Selenomonas caprae]|uniref:D-glycero-beta-D-manno-heptose-7-phosphate kinase n=1 Tax=Selenomonas caprae TaxID=2606905 RepID=UPI002105B8CF|nr:D-glycero-beta-D-manno-heptose-7-phosphate kinase [Selenomonas caprae]